MADNLEWPSHAFATMRGKGLQDGHENLGGELKMTIRRLLLLGMLALMAMPCGSALAGGWRIGIGVGYPGYYRPYPYRVYVASPVYVAPAPGYYYVQPAPVYVQPPPVYAQPAPAYVQPPPPPQPAPSLPPQPVPVR
jgi:hypothetical protein